MWYYAQMISVLSKVGIDYESDQQAAIVWELVNEIERVFSTFPGYGAYGAVFQQWKSLHGLLALPRVQAYGATSG